ncbi:MAG: NAD(P)-binding domain-containing protein [Actinomycetota bacterium]|nr:NAD(P)-binding domain-containing protein [Actinomycetota bacterium]
MRSELPVVVIGAGPQGLAAAAHLLERGLEPMVLEAGSGPGHAVSEWGHVRLFSAWSELMDQAAVRLLEPSGWTAPAPGYPTGADWVQGYLAPLAAALGDSVRYDAKVVGVSRRGRDRLVDAGRAEQPFTIHVLSSDGVESRLDARAVIDASGTWTQPNPAGADGLPALGERAAADAITYQVPKFTQLEGYAARHTVVVGSGHSALTAIIELAEVARSRPGTRITWALRRGVVGNTFGGGAADELPQRGALGVRAKQAVEAGLVELVTGFRVEQIRRSSDGVVLVSEDDHSLPVADQVVVLTGFRPDLSFLTEMRLELDTTLQAPVRMAVEIDPNIHSCGSVGATGAKDLVHPEPDLYLVGMKSYGRAPTFLAMTGYEQVRSVVAELAGDHEAAARVQLELPDTGVCGGAGLFDDPDAAASGGCCGPSASAPVPVTLSLTPVS